MSRFPRRSHWHFLSSREQAGEALYIWLTLIAGQSGAWASLRTFYIGKGGEAALGPLLQLLKPISGCTMRITWTITTILPQTWKMVLSFQNWQKPKKRKSSGAQKGQISLTALTASSGKFVSKLSPWYHRDVPFAFSVFGLGYFNHLWLILTVQLLRRASNLRWISSLCA